MEKKNVSKELSLRGSKLTRRCTCTSLSQIHTTNDDGEPLNPITSPKQASKCANMVDRKIKK
jgi:hypothetical protein